MIKIRHRTNYNDTILVDFYRMINEIVHRDMDEKWKDRFSIGIWHIKYKEL